MPLAAAAPVRATLLAALFAASPVPVFSQSPQPIFDFQPVADGVWAAVLRERGPFPVTNSLIVVSDEGVLVVDTQQSGPAVREVIARIREISDRPVRWVVNTHAHLDHLGGNDAYLEAFGPEVTVLGHVNTRGALEVDTRASLERETLRRTRDLVEQRARLARIQQDGRLADLEAPLRRAVEVLSAYLDDLRQLELRPPQVTFETEHILHLGAREVHLLHPGPAHTRGDVVVWLPAEGVLAAGDLLEQGLSVVGEGATPTGWAAALERLARLDVSYLLPAHGPLQGRRLLDRQKDLFGTLVREARRARMEGLTMDEAWGRIQDASEAALRAGGPGLPVPRATFVAWLEAALPKAWSEAGP